MSREWTRQLRHRDKNGSSMFCRTFCMFGYHFIYTSCASIPKQILGSLFLYMCIIYVSVSTTSKAFYCQQRINPVPCPPPTIPTSCSSRRYTKHHCCQQRVAACSSTIISTRNATSVSKQCHHTCSPGWFLLRGSDRSAADHAFYGVE